jgi:integral membrane sensor domain MASE1
MLEKARHYLLSTPQRRWTTYGICAAFILATVLMPPFGIAVFGGAFAGWWLAVGIATVFGALVGNRIGVAVEQKAKAPSDTAP